MVTLYGLGGVGKTSVAIEYAHRHLAEFGLVWQFPAGEQIGLASGFKDLAVQLGASDLFDDGDPVTRVHSVLAAHRGDWLLIFDDAPGFASLQRVLPPAGSGRVLITSQDPNWPGRRVEIPQLDQEVAAAFVATRTGSTDRDAAGKLAQELGGLPLALEQACAYMQATGRGIGGYLAVFQRRPIDLLARGEIAGYGRQVATAWALAFDQLQEKFPQAIGLLRLLACCAPEEIPLNLLLQPRPELAEALNPEVAALLLPLLKDPLAADSAVAALRRYSLISLQVEGSVSVHRLVQAVTLDQLPANKAEAWMQAARSLIHAALPADTAKPESWPVCAALLPHVQVTHQPMDKWMLGWLARTADVLVDLTPQLAAKLLRQAIASSPTSSPQHDRLMSRLAEALYRVGESAEAERLAMAALTHVADPDLVVDLHWTLAQCRIRMGRFVESLATIDRALDSPGLSARHRARLLVLVARTHDSLGEVDKAGQAATTALEVASEADNSSAMAWALHVLTIVTGVQGRVADALPLFDRALAVTRADPALTDLRLLLQINKAIALGYLDRYEEAIAAARQARQVADQDGTAIRRVQAHGALGQLLFGTGQWDQALAEVQVLPEDLKGHMAACSDLGIAAVICFHRGEVSEARWHLAAAVPHATMIGNRVIGPLALARSLDLERVGALAEALAVLTAGFVGDTKEPGEIEDLLADAARLAAGIGELSTVQSLAGQAAALAADSPIPHRQANALYCYGLLEKNDAPRLLEAAERYGEAGWPLHRGKALESAVSDFARAGDRRQARAAFSRAVEIYASLGATADITRLRASFHA